MSSQGDLIPFSAAVSLSTVSSIAAFTFIIRWRDTRDKIGWLALIILAVLVVSSVALLGVVSSKDCWLDYQVYRALCQGLLIWNSSLLGVYEFMLCLTLVIKRFPRSDLLCIEYFLSSTLCGLSFGLCLWIILKTIQNPWISRALLIASIIGYITIVGLYFKVLWKQKASRQIWIYIFLPPGLVTIASVLSLIVTENIPKDLISIWVVFTLQSLCIPGRIAYLLVHKRLAQRAEDSIIDAENRHMMQSQARSSRHSSGGGYRGKSQVATDEEVEMETTFEGKGNESVKA